jgi:hypothetical protein
MKKILIFTLILILSCSQAESFVNERDNTQSVSATPSVPPVVSTNDDLKSLEERLTKLESAIENNTLALENLTAIENNTLALEKLTKSISSSNVISVENNSPLVVEIDKSDEEDYGKSPNNPVVEGKPITINIFEDMIKQISEEKISRTIYVTPKSIIEFQGDVDEITQVSEQDYFFGDLGFTYANSKIKLPALFPIANNLMSLIQNENKLEFKFTVEPPKNGPPDLILQMFIGQTFEFEYIILNQ